MTYFVFLVSLMSTFSLAAATPSPVANGLYQVATGVCHDGEGNLTAKPDYARKKVIESFVVDEEFVSVQMGRERHWCRVTEKYRRLKTSEYAPMRGGSPDYLADWGQLMLLRLESVGFENCTEKQQVEIQERYRHYLNESTVLRIAFGLGLYGDDRYSQALPALWSSLVQEDFKRDSIRSSDIYLFEFFADQSSSEASSERSREARQSLDERLRSGSGDCPFIETFVVVHPVTPWPEMKVAAGSYESQGLGCFGQPPIRGSELQGHIAESLVLQVDANQGMELEVRAESCRLRMKFDGGSAKRSPSREGLEALVFSQTDSDGLEVSCDGLVKEEADSKTASLIRGFSGVQLQWLRPSNPYAFWRYGSFLGMDWEEPASWGLRLVSGGRDFLLDGISEDRCEIPELFRVSPSDSNQKLIPELPAFQTKVVRADASEIHWVSSESAAKTGESPSFWHRLRSFFVR